MKYVQRLMLFSGAGFALLALGAASGALLSIDDAVLQWVSTIQTPATLTLFSTINILASDPVIIAALFAVIFALLFIKSPGLLRAGLIALSTTVLGVLLFKTLLNIARPEAALITASGGSFPSGHSAVAFLGASLVFLIVIAFRARISIRIASGVVLIATASLVAFSRMFLGVHRVSEIAAGALLALFFVSASYVLEKKSMRKP